MTVKLLVLGGTTLARELIDSLAEYSQFNTTVCLTRKTSGYSQADRQIVGLLNGASDLIERIKAEKVNWLIDATHAFAKEISQIAFNASVEIKVPLLSLQSAAWAKRDTDNWIEVNDHGEAIDYLSELPKGRHVFLSVGGRTIADYAQLKTLRFTARCIRTDLDPKVENVHLIKARGPFNIDNERQLFKSERFDCLVTKNAGTPATYSKIQVARELNVPVVMIQRPEYETGIMFRTPEQLVEFIIRQPKSNSESDY